jgi:hypothetical protein
MAGRHGTAGRADDVGNGVGADDAAVGQRRLMRQGAEHLAGIFSFRSCSSGVPFEPSCRVGRKADAIAARRMDGHVPAKWSDVVGMRLKARRSTVER